MTGGVARLWSALPLAVLLASCDGQRVEYFTIAIIAGTQLQTSTHDPLPDAIRSLASYYQDPNCHHRIFVPVVKVRRVDLNPERVDSLADPLSGVNRWRRRISFLPASRLMADYDDGWQRLPMPSLVAAKTEHVVDIATMRQAYPRAEVLVIDDSLSSRTTSLRARIQTRLCSAPRRAFEIIFDRRGEA